MSTATAVAQKLYQAEEDLRKISDSGSIAYFNGDPYYVGSNNLPTVSEVENFFHLINNSPKVTERFGLLPPCSISVSKNLAKKSYYSNNKIVIAQRYWAMNKQLVVHEYSHHIFIGKMNHLLYPHEDMHGDKFTEIYMWLLETFIGGDYALLLKDLLDSH